MTAFGLGDEACVVVSVMSTRPHPSRSGLRLVTVDRGGTQRRSCAAPPTSPTRGPRRARAAGYPPAREGHDHRAPPSIAGVPSEGMLCSEAELGLGDDATASSCFPPARLARHPLSRRSQPRATPSSILGPTPNRPDGLGHLGLARQAAALFACPSTPAPPGRRHARDEASQDTSHVSIEDGGALPSLRRRRAARRARGALAPRCAGACASLGVRPISNLVDVTNLVMLESGHPMHAFDLDRVRGARIVVRRATRGREAPHPRRRHPHPVRRRPGHLPMARAPWRSRASWAAATARSPPPPRASCLECAYFDPRGVRRASRRHGLHTESSHRFERGVDWGDTRRPARAASLVGELAGAGRSGRASRGAGPVAATVRCGTSAWARLLGVPYRRRRAATLGRLGFTRRATQPQGTLWEVPSFRPDVSREIDLIEEVAGVRGFDAIPSTRAIRPRARAPREGSGATRTRAGVAVGLARR